MRLRHVAVAVVVVLAGCNAPLAPGSGAGTPTATPTPTPTPAPTPTATPAPDPADVGLSADGVDSPVRLVAAHDSRLNDRSYTLRQTTTVRAPNGTVLVHNRRTVVVEPGGDRFAWNASGEVADGTPLWLERSFPAYPSHRVFSNETATTVVLVDRDGQRQVVRYDEEGTGQSLLVGRSLTGSDLLQRTFLSVDTRVVGVDRVNGTVRYELAAADGPHDYAPASSVITTTDVVALEAAVERTGVVRELVLQYTFERNGTRYGVTTTLSVTDVGATTVERPAWLEDLASNESASPAVRRTRTTP